MDHCLDTGSKLRIVISNVEFLGIQSMSLLEGICFTLWLNISKTKDYLCFTLVLLIR